MFTEIEALGFIQLLLTQRKAVEKDHPTLGPAQVAYFTLTRVATILAVDAHITCDESQTLIVPQPTELE